MVDTSTVLGGVLESFKEEGKKIVKETGKQLVGSVNILEGLDPVNPSDVADKSKHYEAEKKAKLVNVRSGLSMMEEFKGKPQEDRRIEQGAEQAERGQTNQNAQMNNPGGQPLSASQTPKKQMEPLVVQQKRQNKLHGAG